MKGLNIAIMGGRYPCKDILKLLLDDSLKDLDCNILGVADTFAKAEGIGYAKKQNIKIVKKLDSNIGELTMDPQTIHRTILNLVSNSIDVCLDVEDMNRALPD